MSLWSAYALSTTSALVIHQPRATRWALENGQTVSRALTAGELHAHSLDLYEPDLPTFFNNFTSPKIPNDTVPDFLSIDGGKTANLSTVAQDSGVESALDFQTAYSIIYPQGLRLYQVGDSVNVDSVGTFNIFLDALDASYCTYEGGDQPYVDPEYPDPNEGGYTGPLQCGGAPLSNVFSFSYGQIEGALPYFYQQRQCQEWMKLGLQGVRYAFFFCTPKRPDLANQRL